jgi:hypothetical protein
MLKLKAGSVNTQYHLLNTFGTFTGDEWVTANQNPTWGGCISNSLWPVLSKFYDRNLLS